MTREGGGVVGRWARRKRAARAPEPPVPAAEAPVEIPPAAESIDLGEIAGWLKRNVPAAWKTAALRRLWVADPAIRNFVGMADYAWDWNTPGGAPGYGALRTSDDVAALLQRIIFTPEPAASTPSAASAGPIGVPPVHVAVAPPSPVPIAAEVVAPAYEPPIRRRGGKATPV